MFNPNDDSVADLLKRARTTHTSAPSNPFNPLDLSGLSAASNNFPTTGVPGSVAGRSNTEYGTNPNYGQQRQDMMSEIDFMMSGNPFNPLDTSGGQGDVSGRAFNNPHLGEQEWAGQVPSSSYEPEPVLPPGPGPGYYGQSPMSGNDQWIPNNPLAPASTYGELPGAGPGIYGGTPNQGGGGTVLDPVGAGAGPNNMFSPLNAAMGDVLDPVGQGAGPSDMYGNGMNVGGPGYGTDGPGAGPSMYGATPDQGEDSVPYNIMEGNPEGMGPGMNQLGIGGSRTEDGQVVAQNPETAVANYEVEKKLDDDLLAAKEERWAAASGKDERQQYLDDLKAVHKKQRIMYALAAFSGNEGLASLAGQVASQDTAILQQKYNWAEEDRFGQMSDALMYNSNGKYDPPQNMDEFNQAMTAMGASSEERDWFEEQYFGDAREDNTYRNFINTKTGESYSGYGPKDESGEWAITGQYDYGTKDGKTPGGVDMEKYAIWQEAKRANKDGAMSDEELSDLKKALGLSDKGITLNQEFSMFESIYKSGVGGRWKIPGLKGQPKAADIEDAFQEFREKTMPTLRGVMPDETDDGDSDSISVEAATKILDKDPSPDNIKYFIETYGKDKLPSKYK